MNKNIKIGDIVEPIDDIKVFSHSKISKVLGINGDTLRLQDGRGNVYYAKAHLYNKVAEFGEGGRVSIWKGDVPFDAKMYEGIMDDYDNDGVPNADDMYPTDPTKKGDIEHIRFTDTFADLLAKRKNYQTQVEDLVEQMDKDLPSNYKIYARTKTPFSVIRKLIESRLEGDKGLTDMVGTTIAVDNNKELEKVADMIGKCKGTEGIYGKVLEFDDKFTKPKCGYRAYHFIVEYDGTPVEIQVKTKRMKELNEFSHPLYKAKVLDCQGMGEVSRMVYEADNGDVEMQKEVTDLLADKDQLRQMISTEKFAKGGSIEWFDWRNADIPKLPYDNDKYFNPNPWTMEIMLEDVVPTRAREKGVRNANKFMKLAHDGEMERRKPISVFKRDGKWHVMDGNSTFANALNSGWKTIYADEVEDPEKTLFEAENKVEIVKL